MSPGQIMVTLVRALDILRGMMGLGQKSTGSDLYFTRLFWLPLGNRLGRGWMASVEVRPVNKPLDGLDKGEGSFTGARLK